MKYIDMETYPRIVFGKYIREGDKVKMPLSIQRNHALVDGWHLGLFYRNFEKINADMQ